MKSLLNYFVIAAIAVSVAFTSCKKNKNNDEKEYDVYVTGNSRPVSSYYDPAALWINNNVQRLTDGNFLSMASSIFRIGQ